MLEDLKKNIEQEKKIVRKMEEIEIDLKSATEKGRKFYLDSFDALKKQLKILNNSVPLLLENISGAKKLKKENVKIPENAVKMSYVSGEDNEKKSIVINKTQQNNFIKEVGVSEQNLGRIKKEKKIFVNEPSYIAHLSNKLFFNWSEKIADRFGTLKENLKKANIRFTIIIYLSIALFFSLLSFAVSFLILVVLIIIDFSFIMWIWIPFAIAGLCFGLFYVYPIAEKESIKKKINSELPFATIYMATVAGSDIEPTQIFKIIATSPEYKNVGYEIKKVINQVEVYGYDLVTSLKNASKITSNKELAELFSGLAINIVSGGSLKNYLEQKAENFLIDYKLERQKYSRLAETFMDIYISILVAAPMVLMMLVVIMNLTELGGGMSFNLIVTFAIIAVVFINIIFLIALHLKQPKA